MNLVDGAVLNGYLWKTKVHPCDYARKYATAPQNGQHFLPLDVLNLVLKCPHSCTDDCREVTICSRFVADLQVHR